jgi:hypothetical protein
VPQGDPQHDDAPEHMNRVIIASLAAGGSKGVEQFAVGESGEEILDRMQRGAVFQAVPGEERFGSVDDHGERLVQG